ncbi:hypothetical protein Poly30_00880 [Planctomycetes bacterium Poly30]|uniref:SGNH hydrolase-type esterase domain-containing protein n=2 Tax=Saltatorellus ferox TaxID=2528018 RepID=A0A518EKI1_9BACT|nr:hypothetical protein Poly30_00880 [Planctomycetes bacterium Poly30]
MRCIPPPYIFLLTPPTWVIEWAILGWSLLAVGVPLLWFGWSRRRSAAGKILMNLGFLLAFAGAVEVGYWATRPSELERRPPSYQAYIVDDPDLGYTALAGARASVELWDGSTQVYGTEYVFDEFGTRRVPAVDGASPTGSLLCFGGSFMMGEGLAEDETLPARLQAELGGRLRVINFGLHGQGAHQMLARCRSGRIEAMPIPPPKAALYWAIPDHIVRAAGLRSWDKAGPLYESDHGGRVKEVGTFADLPGHPLPAPGTTGLASISWIRRRTMRTQPKTTSMDLERWAGIVATAQDEVHERFPGCSFHVLLDDPQARLADTMQDALRKRGIEALRVSQFLDGYRGDPKPWRMHAKDVHPTAKATEILAAGLVPRIKSSSH